MSPALLPGVWLQSELAGGLGLQLRLLSDLLMAVWLATTGLTCTRHAPVTVRGADAIAVSDPAFLETLARLRGGAP